MKIQTMVAVLLAALVGTGCAGTPPVTEDEADWGGPTSVAFAERLWAALRDAGLTGPGAIAGMPYVGSHPHGAVLDTLDATVAVDGRRGEVIVKRDYRGRGVTVASVVNDRTRNLNSVAVMFRREVGYDPGNRDWFWVQYDPDGRVGHNGDGALLAGRVAKGLNAGCIACHRAAPGGDFVFSHDRLAR